MAGQRINLTRSIYTITDGANAWQASSQALDILGYSGARLDFSLKVYGLNGPSGVTPSATVKIYTSMYNDDDNDNWKLAATFPAVTTSNKVVAVSATTGLLQYIKWGVEVTNVNTTSFEILGVAW